MCLYGTNLNFLRDIVPRCSWQVCGVYLAVCMSRECLYDPTAVHPHTSLHVLDIIDFCSRGVASIKYLFLSLFKDKLQA